MMIGVTGHRVLPNHATWNWLSTQLKGFLQELGQPIMGVTSLAIGADQLFAEVLLEIRAEIFAVIPFTGYERTFENETDLRNYLRFMNSASRIEILTPSASDEQAYLRAGERVVDVSELLVAIWNGEEARGLGGTKDIVDYAMFLDKPLVQFNPITREIIRREKAHD
jgi:hypothetical protein